jgi:hypothetical protein
LQCVGASAINPQRQHRESGAMLSLSWYSGLPEGSGLPCPIQGFIVTSPGRTTLSDEVLVSLTGGNGLPRARLVSAVHGDWPSATATTRDICLRRITADPSTWRHLPLAPDPGCADRVRWQTGSHSPCAPWPPGRSPDAACWPSADAGTGPGWAGVGLASRPD